MKAKSITSAFIALLLANPAIGVESDDKQAPECSIYPDSLGCMELENFPDSSEHMDAEDIGEEPEDDEGEDDKCL